MCHGMEFRSVIIAGSHFANSERAGRLIEQAIGTLGLDRSLVRVISGGARCVDEAAANWAHNNGVKFTAVLPDWKKHGRRAGLMRNRTMAEMAVRSGHPILIALWNGRSRGTSSMIEVAAQFRIPSFVIPIR